MIPFRVFDREKKEMWIILNYQNDTQGGSYLAAKEDDNDQDGTMRVISVSEMTKMRLVDFLDDGDDYRD